MSDSWDLDEMDDEDLPPLDTQEGRDQWVEIMLEQDSDELDADGGWVKALVVRDDDNMMVRFRYADNTEEVFDLVIRRAIVTINTNEGESN